MIENDSAKFCKKCGTNIENEPVIMTENPGGDVESEPKEEIITIVENDKPQGQPQNQPQSVTINTYTPEINGFFTFVLWMIVLGGILTPIIGLAAFNEADYVGSIWLILSDISVYILTPIYAIYTVVSTYKRRSGAVALLKAYLITIMAYKLLLQLVTGFASIDASTVSGLVWNMIFLLYVCFSEKVSDNFPKEIRKVSAFDKIMIWSYILIPLITLILGYLQLILGL
jgi:hypothetical protein